jgi:(p)ppGpp synthase/HD superfamily hydrolase
VSRSDAASAAENVAFSPLVETAIAFAIRSHEGQERKGQAGVPYVVHPIHVGLLLARHGQRPAVVAAGILHDVMEDGEATFEQLERAFDREVAALVAEVSEEKARTWEERKQHTIDAIATMSEGARAVTAADKVHNLADLQRLLAQRGDEVWKLFRRGRGPTLDYYRRVFDQLSRHFRHPLTDELGAALAAIERAQR